MKLAAFLGALVFSLGALAQTFPAKPVKIIVGYPPGAEAPMLERVVRESGAKVD